jgi:hypothetical protein
MFGNKMRHYEEGSEEKKRIREYNLKVLKRDKFTCQHCKREKYPVKCDTPSRNTLKLTVHHVRPQALGGNEFDVDNGVTLCSKCHKRLHRWEANGSYRIPGALKKFLIKPKGFNHTKETRLINTYEERRQIMKGRKIFKSAQAKANRLKVLNKRINQLK